MKKRIFKKNRKLSKFDFRNLNQEEKENYDLIKNSNEFDGAYYIKMYNLGSTINPIVHYLKVGVGKGFNPSSAFDTKFYLEFYPDVRDSGMNPFVHYLRYGKRECRIPKYLDKKDILKLKISEDNIVDYLTIKYSDEFDDAYYIKKYNLGSTIDPIVHYLEVGVGKGFNPSSAFDTKFYLKSYSDVRDSGMNPFAHYLRYGKREGRIPKV